MSRSRVELVVAVVVAVAGGCASAGNGGDDNPVRLDAAIVRDAPASIDAGVVVDAPVDAPAAPLDAPPGSLFCTANSQCTVAGECCLDLGGSMGFCTEGTIFLGECTPF